MDEQRAEIHEKKTYERVFKGKKVSAYSSFKKVIWKRNIKGNELFYSIDYGVGAIEKSVPTKMESVPVLEKDVREKYGIFKEVGIEADIVEIEQVEFYKKVECGCAYESLKKVTSVFATNYIGEFKIFAFAEFLDGKDAENYIKWALDIQKAPERKVRPEGSVAFFDLALLELLSFIEGALDGRRVKEGKSFFAYSELPKNFKIYEVPNAFLTGVASRDDDFAPTESKVVKPMYDLYLAKEYNEKQTGNGFFIPHSGYGTGLTNVKIEVRDKISLDEFTGVLTNNVLGFHTSSIETGELRAVVAQGVQYVNGEPVGFVKNIPITKNIIDLLRNAFSVGKPVKNSNCESPIIAFDL